MLFEYLNPHPHDQRAKKEFLPQLHLSAASRKNRIIFRHFKITRTRLAIENNCKKTNVIIVYARMDMHFCDGNFFVNFPSKSNAVDLQIVQIW